MKNPSISVLEKSLGRLHSALRNERSIKYCHTLWSKFVRLRDEHCCIVCGSEDRIAAHHIYRKSFLYYARFETGNGITLCKGCHAEAHEGFNGSPDFDQPMDAQGGEKIELAFECLRLLIESAAERSILRDDFYYFSDASLLTFKKFQTIKEDLIFPGTRLEQAWRIWRQTPRCVLKAILGAQGVTVPDDFIQPDNGLMIMFDPPEPR